MKKDSENKFSNMTLQIQEISKVSMRVYAIFAIILVLIPEWLAELTIALENINKHQELPKLGSKWNEDPELKLSKMSFKEIRNLAHKLKVQGYSRDSKDKLTRKLLKKLGATKK